MGIRIGLGTSPVLAVDRLPWQPSELGLRAWYDAELGQPKNVGYVQLNGASGDYITTPDSAALSFSNDIEVVMRVKVTDWSAAAIQTLVGKYVTTSNQRSWKVASNTSGQIIITVSVDGTATNTATITPSTALPDNTWIWLRARLDLTNGSNSVGTIETAADAGTNDEPSSWTANGTATATTLAGIFDSTAPLEIGSFQNGTSERLSGQVGRCIVRSGFAGTTVADFNASDCYGPGCTGSLGNVWTLGLPKIYDRSGNNVAPATFGAGSNQPLWLPYPRPSVHFEASTSNNMGCPDSPAFDWTNGFSLSWLGASPLVGSNAIASQDNSASRAWYVRQNGVALNVVVAGTLTLNTANTGAIANRWQWWRVRFTPDNGAGASQMWLETSLTTDQDEPTVWTLVDTQTGAITAIPDSTASFVIGAVGGVGVVGNGDLSRVVARTGSAGTGTPVVNWHAANCSQSGCTDLAGNVFTANRATAGAKLVVQSPVAGSARAVVLLRTDDWIDVPAAAIPALDTFAAASSVTASFKRWHNPGAAGHAIFTTKATNANTSLGSAMRLTTSASSPTIAHYVGDGVAADGAEIGTNAPALGVRAVQSMAVGNVSPFVDARSNGALNGNDTARATTVSTSTGGAGRIGAYTGGTGAIDMELEALVFRDSAISDTEHGQLTAYYRGGL